MNESVFLVLFLVLMAFSGLLFNLLQKIFFSDFQEVRRGQRSGHRRTLLAE